MNIHMDYIQTIYGLSTNYMQTVNGLYTYMYAYILLCKSIDELIN